jgi:outer membrane biogenesis lipoprotein LolB
MSAPAHSGGLRRPLSEIASRLLPLLMLSACAGRPYRKVLSPDLLELGPVGVLREASARTGPITGMRTTGTLQVRLDGGALSGNVVVRYAAPDSFRFDITAFMGVTVTQAVLTGDRARIWIPAERTVMEGRIDPDAMLSINGFPLHPSMVREWVLGPALGRDWSSLYDGIDRFDIGNGQVVIGLRMPDGNRLLLILGEDLIFRSAAFLDPLGRMLWQSRYTGWRRQKGVLLPGRIEVSYPGAGLEVLFDVVRRDFRSERGADDFRLPIPPDARRRPIGPAVPPGGTGR